MRFRQQVDVREDQVPVHRGNISEVVLSAWNDAPSRLS